VFWITAVLSHAPGLNLNSTESGLLHHNQFPQSPIYYHHPSLYAFVIRVIRFQEISPSKFDVVSLGCDRHPPQTDLMGLMLIIISVTRIRNLSAHFVLSNFFHSTLCFLQEFWIFLVIEVANFRKIKPDKILNKYNRHRSFSLLDKRDVGKIKQECLFVSNHQTSEWKEGNKC